MELTELYNHLVQEGFLWPQKIRVHVGLVAKKIENLLFVDANNALSIAQELVIRARKELWLSCLHIKPTWSRFTLWEQLEELLDAHYLRQSGDIWGDIKKIIADFNKKTKQYRLPVDKPNIAISLSWKRNITIMEFISLLALDVEYIRHSSWESVSTLVPLWETSLGMIFEYKWKQLTLFDHLVSLIYTPNVRRKWQKAILVLLECFYQNSWYNLGFSSWTTMSRWIMGRNYDYISQDDFLQFIKKLKSSTSVSV